MRIVFFSVLALMIAFVFLCVRDQVFASEYVFPYPSFMPGNKLYKVSRIFDELGQWWFFGNISSFKYHLKLADKYLVEAKTLFEYKQYKLGVDALRRSDKQIPQIRRSLSRARLEGKQVKQFESIFTSAMNVHIDVLKKLSEQLPENFQWNPEKRSPETINFSQILSNSIEQRAKVLK